MTVTFHQIALGIEQISNGTFEIGNLSGWSYQNFVALWNAGHYGTYSARGNGVSILHQTLNVLASGILTFGFWYKNSANANLEVTIEYSDSTQTQENFNGYYANWTYINLLPYFTPSKIISGLRFECQTSSRYYYIDDVTLILSLDLTLEHIIDFNVAQINQVAIPRWINNSASIMSSVWSKTKEKVEYIARLTDEELYTLIRFSRLHEFLDLTDSDYYGVTVKWTWIEDWTAEYEGEVNAISPWKVTIKIIVEDQS